MAKKFLYIHEPHCYLFSVLFDGGDAMKHATETMVLSDPYYRFPSQFPISYQANFENHLKFTSLLWTTKCWTYSYPFLLNDKFYSSKLMMRLKREREHKINTNFYPLKVLSFCFSSPFSFKQNLIKHGAIFLVNSKQRINIQRKDLSQRKGNSGIFYTKENNLHPSNAVLFSGMGAKHSHSKNGNEKKNSAPFFG